MEAFSLLKYWRTSGGTTALFTGDSTFSSPAATNTAATPYSDYGEDGPYFDLEFTLSDETEAGKGLENEDSSEKTETESGSFSEEFSDDENYDDDDEYISLTSDEIADHNVTLSPSDELFFKVPIEPSNKSPVSLLKSASNFRVRFLKLKKSKSANGVLEEPEKSQKSEDKSVSGDGKLFTVKFKVEEVRGPLSSLFARDNNSSKRCAQDSDTNSSSDERKLTKEVVQKYLKMLKPLYVRVSSRYVEKMKFSSPVSFLGGGAVSLPCKHLGKSRSTSVTVAAAPPGMMVSNRRDDSLLQLQDGIQGAILHCKRSFNASRDGESATLSRSASDPSE